MKRILLITIGIAFLLSSCNKLKEATTVKVNTKIAVDIPIVVNEAKASSLKSAKQEYVFSKTKTKSLKDNSEIKEYLDRLKSVDIKKIDTEIKNLAQDEKIIILNITVKDVGVIATIKDISLSNNNYEIERTNKFAQTENLLANKKEITVTISGKANKPMNFTAKLIFDCVAKANVLK